MNTKASLRKSAVLLMIAAAYFVSVSGKVNETEFCDCGPSKDPKKFVASLAAVLDDVVKNTASQRKDPVSGDRIYTTTGPAKRGGAAATGTCFGGTAFFDCPACLSEARSSLKPCGGFACGGLRVDGKCRMQFRQLK